jgi:RNA polymerase sigma-70 factor, ECF subfamily
MRDAINRVEETEKSDSELMKQFHRGDEEAFVIIVGRNEPLLFRMARTLLANEQQALDICQYVWIQLFQFHPTWNGSLRSWLVTVMTHRCYDELRRRKRSALPLSTLELDENEVEQLIPLFASMTTLLPENLLEDWEYQQRFLLALKQLPTRSRTIVALRATGYSFGEIAKYMGCKEATVRTWAARARPLLQRILARSES